MTQTDPEYIYSVPFINATTRDGCANIGWREQFRCSLDTIAMLRRIMNTDDDFSRDYCSLVMMILKNQELAGTASRDMLMALSYFIKQNADVLMEIIRDTDTTLCRIDEEPFIRLE